VADIVRSTLGPRGMDKLIHKDGKVIISNDGATIMKNLEIVHPAALTLVDIARSQDSEAGDGTTSVVVLANEFMKEAKPFVEEGVHPQVIIKSYRQASRLALEKLKEWSIDITGKNDVEKRELLIRCAATSLNSKLIAHQKMFFAPIIVDAVMSLDEDLSLDMIGVKKVAGGTLEDSKLIKGVAFKKTFSYAGFEQQPKKFKDCKIVLLNVELSSRAKRRMPRSASTTPTSTRALSTPSGISFMRSWTRSRPRVPRSSFRASPSATSPRSTLRTVAFSAPAVCPTMTFAVSPRHVGRPSRPQSTTSRMRLLASAAPLRRSKLGMRGTTCLRSAPRT